MELNAEVKTKMSKKSKKKTICAAGGCSNYQGISEYSFHHFPLDPELSKQWVYRLKRKDLEGLSPAQLKNRVVCSLHFHSSDIIKNKLR